MTDTNANNEKYVEFFMFLEKYKSKVSLGEALKVLINHKVKETQKSIKGGLSSLFGLKAQHDQLIKDQDNQALSSIEGNAYYVACKERNYILCNQKALTDYFNCTADRQLDFSGDTAEAKAFEECKGWTDEKLKSAPSVIPFKASLANQ